MTITKNISKNEAVLAFDGWLDTQAAPEMHAEVEALGEDIKSIVFDFGKLEYISSSGIREVVAAYKKVGGELKIKNASPGIMSIFKATGIDRKITFE